MADLFENPMGLDGFEFVEFCAPEKGVLEPVFEAMGFTAVATHRSKDVSPVAAGRDQPHRQLRTEEPAAYFAASTGRPPAAWRFRVRDAHKAYDRALERGAEPVDIATGPMELRLPAIRGIGGAIIYLIDRYGDGSSIYDIDFEYLPGVDRAPRRRGFQQIDHLTHNVYGGRMAYLGDVLRAALQLPRDPLFRHQGRIHRPAPRRR